MQRLESIVEAMRTTAKADFAFVMTRRGRVVTHDAPRDMPAAGREALLEAATELPDDGSRFAHITLAREALVPFGGAAPIEVFVAMRHRALICLVLPSWAEHGGVIRAFEEGLEDISNVLEEALASTKKGKKRRSKMPPQRESARREAEKELGKPAVRILTPATLAARKPRPRPEVALTQRGVMAGLLNMSANSVGYGDDNAPEISIDSAPVGRETMAAIDRDQQTAALEGSLPEIHLATSAVGRETMAAIDSDVREGIPKGDPHASSPDVRLSLRSRSDMRPSDAALLVPTASDGVLVEETDQHVGRMTRPWVESPADTKRMVDAQRSARRHESPGVTLRLSDYDEADGYDEEDEDAILDAALQDPNDASEPPPERISALPARSSSTPPGLRPDRKGGARDEPDAAPETGEVQRQSLDVWRDAIQKYLDDEPDQRKAPAESGTQLRYEVDAGVDDDNDDAPTGRKRRSSGF